MTSESTNGLGSFQEELLALFDVLVNVMFCVKDRNGRYVEVNQAFVRRSGRRSKRDVIGNTARDLFSTVLAGRYEEQDQQVFETGQALRDELELIRRPNGSLGWYLTTKIPIGGDDDEPVGLVSVSRDLETPSEEGIAVESLTHVVDLVHERLSEPLRVADLAAAAGCSEAQLERRMRRVFGLTATQYVLRARTEHATQLLLETTRPLAEVAVASGFYDQSSFTHTFARLTGETPAQFRLSHRRHVGPDGKHV
jgi:PAS domain S-box-containing protein